MIKLNKLETTGRFGRTFCGSGCEMYHDTFERRFKDGTTHWIRFCPSEGSWRHVKSEEVEILRNKKVPVQTTFL